MDESKYPTAGSTIREAAKSLDLDDASYTPPSYSFPIFDDTLYKPAEFGKAMRDANFTIGDFTFLNNGSFGACPKVVIEAQKRWEEYLEKSPVSFYMLDLPVFEVHVIRELAKFIGAPAKNVLLVENASMGCNVVLRSIPFTKDDEVVFLNIGYTSVINTMNYLASRIGFKPVQVDVKTPIVMSQLLQSLREAITPNTKLVVFDHISSSPGNILPIKDMTAICKAKGVPILVDGAHAVGQVPLNMKELGADFYVSNCHKWSYSAKGSAFLYASDEHLAKLHPTVISNDYASTPQVEFLFSGTGNYSPKLTILTALHFYNKVGGPEKVMKYCHDLAWEAANELKRAWGTHFVVSETENENYEQYFGNMVAIALPIPKFSTGEKARGHAQWLRLKLWSDYKLEVPITVLDNQLYARISAQIWNEKADFLKLVPIIKEIYEALEK